MTSSSQQQPPVTVVMWIMWFAILNGLFMIAFFAAPRPPEPELRLDEANLPFVALSVVSGMISLGIRFMLIPKMSHAQGLLVAMMVGLAIAEGSGIIGMFVVPSEYHTTRLFMLAVAVICILIHAPIYAGKFKGGATSNQVEP